ncbi:MAG TPA: hypothetical protein VF024_10175 [Solirubrobacteraceae bacterium]
MRVPIPGPDCKLGQIERGTVDLPPVSAGFAIDGAKVYYANSAGVRNRPAGLCPRLKAAR